MSLKVVLDIVTNHMGQLFYYDMNLNGNPDINIGGSGPLQGAGSQSPITRITEFDPGLGSARRAGVHVARQRRSRADHLHPGSVDQPRAAAPASSARRARTTASDAS